VQNAGNDWQIDREAMRSNLIYSGIRNIVMQDQAVTESMGPIVDHTKEHLARSDIMISRTRRRLLNVARAFAENGTVPPGVDDTEVFWKARAGSFYADAKVDWLDAYQEQLKAAEKRRADFREKYADLITGYDGNVSRLDAGRARIAQLELDVADARAKRDSLQKDLNTIPKTVSIDAAGPQVLIAGQPMGYRARLEAARAPGSGRGVGPGVDAGRRARTAARAGLGASRH